MLHLAQVYLLCTSGRDNMQIQVYLGQSLNYFLKLKKSIENKSLKNRKENSGENNSLKRFTLDFSPPPGK